MTSSRLVGRVGELAELELAWHEAAAGHARCSSCSAASPASARPGWSASSSRRLGDAALVLRGEGLDQGEAELPYAPLLGALRELVRGEPPGARGAERGQPAPAGGAAAGPRRRRRAIAEPRAGTGQLRLFEALLELIGRLSDERPVLLILEDMHWADRSTRTFVSFLVRSLRCERVLVLLSFRSDELHRRHPLRPLLAELERLERTRRIELERLDRDGARRGAHRHPRRSPDRAARSAGCIARSEGNPLYTEELLAAGLDGRGAAPQSLRDAFMLRIERLPADAQAAVRAIAAARRLDEASVAELTGLPPPRRPGGAARGALRAGARSPTPTAVCASATSCCARSCSTTCCPASGAELHLALARMLESPTARRARSPRPSAPRRSPATTPPPGEQPRGAARRASRPRARPMAVHAYGAAADLAEDALELWPRVAGRRGRSPASITSSCCCSPPRAHAIGGDRPRVEALLAERAARAAGRMPTRSAGRASSIVSPAPSGRSTAASRGSRPPSGRWSCCPRTRACPSGRCCSRGSRGPACCAAACATRCATASGRWRAAQSPPAIRAPRPRCSTRSGWPQMALGQEEEGDRRGCSGRWRSPGRPTTSRPSPTPTPTSPTCSTSAAGPREALAVAREGLAVIPRWLGARPRTGRR